MLKMMVFPANFLFFKILVLWVFRGKRVKIGLELTNFIMFCYVSGTEDHIIEILKMIYTVVFYFIVKNAAL